jgi:hypothetical protein
MKKQMSAALVLLLAGLAAGMAQAQAADATSNLPPRAGEASTMTNGVPNLLTSNVQPGELGPQSRLRLRPAAPSVVAASAYGGDPGLKMMGGPGLSRPVLISPPGAAR